MEFPQVLASSNYFITFHDLIVGDDGHEAIPMVQNSSSSPAGIKASATKRSGHSYGERRFNLVLYGVRESPEGTNLYDQIKSDNQNALTILHKINPSITDLLIRGCFRIGKFSPTKIRPLIVVFQRVQDVCLILQRLSPDILPRGIAIKPHMSATEMKVESILLRERWKLYTQSGVDKRQIKIRGRKLFIDSHLVGEVVDGEYKPVDTSISS